MMNQLKTYAVRNNVVNFLTYADNFAIGYFSKQGFTKAISLPRAVFVLRLESSPIRARQIKLAVKFTVYSI